MAKQYVKLLSNIGFDVVVTMTDGQQANNKFPRIINANESVEIFIRNPFNKVGKVFCYMILFICSIKRLQHFC